MEFNIKDIKFIEDFEGNRYKQINKDEPFEECNVLIGMLSVGDNSIKIEGLEIERVSLRKEDRRTLNNFVFAKIV